MSWTELSIWWIDELNAESTYEGVATPLLFDVFSPLSNELYLDLGAGTVESCVPCLTWVFPWLASI